MYFEIRKATEKDVETLTAMRLEMRRERETASLTVPEEEFERITREYFRKVLASEDFVSYIAWAGEEAAACSGMSIHLHAPSYGNLSGKTGYIFNMYTRSAYRRQGLAVKLLAALQQYAEEKGCSKLGLNASPAGKNVYLKYGFAEVGGEMEMGLKEGR